MKKIKSLSVLLIALILVVSLASCIADTTVKTKVLSFNTNGGKAITTTSKVRVGETYAKLPVPERTGYDFKGWFFDEGLTSEVKEDTVVDVYQSYTLFAAWSQHEYTVTLDYRDGKETHDVTSISVYYEGAYGTLPQPTKDQAEFLGWYSYSTETGSLVTKDTVNYIAADHTLYAHWSDDFIMTFYLNGGLDDTSATITPIEVTNGQATTWPVTTKFNKTGYTFKGWCVDADGTGTMYNSGDVLEPERDMTFYAIWEPVDVTVNLYYEKGETPALFKTYTVKYDSSIEAMPLIPDDDTNRVSNADFLGWFTVASENYVTEYKEGTKITTVDAINLYGKWDKAIYTVTLDFNFDSIDGANNKVNDFDKVTYQVEKGTRVVIKTSTADIPKIAYPVRPGYTFGGWYLEDVPTENSTYFCFVKDNSSTEKKILSEKVVTSDITLHAHWVSDQLDYSGVNTATLKDGATGDIVVPTYFMGLTTVKIGTPVSTSTADPKPAPVLSGVTSVTLPLTISTINDSAFEGCSNNEFTTISIPSNVTTIGASAFKGCTNLKTVNIPSGVTAINTSTFEGCSSLESIDIPSEVLTIDDCAFKGAGLKSVTIPSSVGTKVEGVQGKIGNSVFANCVNLEKLVIECLFDKNLVPYFYNDSNELQPNTKLTTVKIDETTADSSKTLGDGIFTDFKALETVSLPEDLKILGNNFFKNCESLESIVLPSTLTSIKMSAFYNCSNLKSITLPEKVNEVKTWAFYKCGSLKEVTICVGTEKTINSLLETNNLFDSIKGNIEKVTFTNATILPDNAFNGFEALKEVDIPEVTEIGENAFNGCTKLAKVNMPKATTFGEGAFTNAGSDSSVTKMDITFLPTADLNATVAFEGCKGVIAVTFKKDSTPDNDKILYFVPGTNIGKNNSYVKDYLGDKAGFNGWWLKFTSPTYTYECNLDTYPLVQNTTLYAKWLTKLSYLSPVYNTDSTPSSGIKEWKNLEVDSSVCSAVTSTTTAMGTAGATKWYVVDGTVTVSGRIVCTGDVNLILTDGSKLTASSGITVTGSNSLTIYAQSTDEATMGVLNATAALDSCAAIGGDGTSEGTKDGQNITINGGKITAIAKDGSNVSAGIGGGSSSCFGSGNSIIINGGIINAKGANATEGMLGRGAAGIGGGQVGSAKDIYINGGTVTATGGQMAGAGIGGGIGGSVLNIYINGGTVTANGGMEAAGIGTGQGDSKTVSNISITGGTVTANGGMQAAGIGTGKGDSTSVSNISITGGTVTATGMVGGAGIGTGLGNSTSVSDIIIQGGTVKANAGAVYYNFQPSSIGVGDCSVSTTPGTASSIQAGSNMIVKAGVNETSTTDITHLSNTYTTDLAGKRYCEITPKTETPT